MTELFGEGTRPRPGEWRLSYVIELMCLIVGMLCLGWFGWNWIGTELEQRKGNQELQSALQSQSALQLQSALHTEQASDVETPPGARKVPDPAPRPHILPGGIIGRVELARLNISAVVRAGVDDKTLKHSVGHVPDTALPGEPGNVGIAAHRDTFFRNLKGVKIGDEIRMVTPAGTYKYVVQSLRIVWPKNVEVLDATPEPAMTLVTCYPFNYIGSAPKRFIVRAKQIVPASESETASNDQRSRNRQMP